MHTKEESWDLIIKPKNKWYRLDIADIWKHRDLLMLLVRRDFIAVYKQTLLGPLWFFIQPIFTTIVYYFMFGRIASIPTDSQPALLFYMGGLVCWNYFSECINNTSNVFINNAALFSKVYFPRLLLPISSIISAGIKFFIQLLLFLTIWAYYVFIKGNAELHFSWQIVLVPFLLLLMAVMGMSIGLIVSALTTKYRDLKNLLGYALQFGLYVTPIIFPLSMLKIKLPAFYKFCLLNPMTGIVETFKFAFFGSGTFEWGLLMYTTTFTLIIFLLSIILFNKIEKSFVDTV
jgi:lipopolysaccharide transport system permease protein